MGGCQLQMGAIGQQGANLVAQAGNCLSFWKNKYALICNSCTNSVEHSANGQTSFNKWVEYNLVRNGHLIKGATAAWRLPGVAPCGADFWAHWNNHIAYTIAQEVQIIIGGILVARAYGDGLRIQHELTVPSINKQTHEQVASTDSRNGLIDWAQWVSRLYYLPLDFWFSWNSGNALPVLAMMQQTITIKIQTCPLNVAWKSGPVGAQPLAITATKNSFAQLNDQSLGAFLYVEWVILDEREADTFEGVELTYLMYQMQRQQTCLSCQSASLILQKVDVCFAHPVFLMAWYVVQTDAVYRKDIWDWSGFNGLDPVVSQQMKSNQDELMSERDALFFRVTLNALKGLNVPSFFVYIWSFAIFPFRFQPSGFLNMSRVDGLALYLRLQPQIREVLVTIFGWNYNWLEVSDNSANAEFAGC